MENEKNVNEQKQAELINYYFYDRKGRRKNLGNDINIAKIEFEKYVKRNSFESRILYCEYYAKKTMHIVTTLSAFYNVNTDSLLYINRNDI